jgi:hypothetical protein
MERGVTLQLERDLLSHRFQQRLGQQTVHERRSRGGCGLHLGLARLDLACLDLSAPA